MVPWPSADLICNQRDQGTLVPYTITVTNVYGAPLSGISIVDRFPAGFKYVAGSARWTAIRSNRGSTVGSLPGTASNCQLNQRRTIRLLLVVGSGVSEGEYVNRAAVLNAATGAPSRGKRRPP